MQFSSAVIPFLQVALLAPTVTSFVLPLKSTSLTSTSSLNAITKEKVGILDGSNYNALKLFVNAESGKSTKGKTSEDEVGIVQVVVGTLDQNPKDRIIGIAADEDTISGASDLFVTMNGNGGKTVHLYKDSIAKVPTKVSDEDAISTCIAALSGVHCAYFDPDSEESKVIRGVGGGDDDFVLPLNGEKAEKKKVVVLGGGDYASFVADSLSTLGGYVTQITTNKLIRERKHAQVSISPPEIGELELGFSSVLGSFDAIVDTLEDEAKSADAMCMGLDENVDSNDERRCSSEVITMLQKQNNCKRYVSTLNTSQKKVQEDGLLWGRSKADGYGKDVIRRVTSLKRKPDSSIHTFIPPKKYGSRTLQRLLDAGIVYKKKEKEAFLQRWNMGDFLELVSWPREAEGGNIRFGLPVIEDLDDVEQEETTVVAQSPPDQSGYQEKKNPYILDINKLSELNSEVLDTKKDCMLFLSAAYCRTCKYLSPQYLKLAREHMRAGDDVVFAKANAVGKLGKEIRQVLGVDAVPAFCFFRAGERYGNVISVSKMPSKKLDAALDLLISGDNWDARAIGKLK